MGIEQIHRKMITSINKSVFYFDLSTTKQGQVPVFKTFVERYGAKQSTFLDKNVTHLVTDKASTIAEAYAKTCKWKMTLWSYTDFIEALLDLLEYNQDKLGVELLRTTIISATKGNLNDFLAEEQRLTNRHKASRLTPFYGGNSIINNCNPKVTTTIKATTTAVAQPSAPSTTTKTGHSKSFQPFTHPFMLIEETGLFLASIYKQYEPTYSGRPTYPQIYFNTAPTHCPFVFSRSHARPVNELREVEPVKVDEQVKAADENVPPKPGQAENNPLVSPTQAQTPRSRSKLLAKRSYQAAELNKKAFVPKPRPGYCECCLERYDDLVKHIKTDYHRLFAGNASNYIVVDKVLQHMARPLLYEFNPIPFWKSGITSSMMSPAHSCITSTYSKKGGSSSSKLTPDNDLIEDKENDSPAGLDLTGVDRDDTKPKVYGFSSEINDPKRRKTGRKESEKLGGRNLKNLFL